MPLIAVRFENCAISKTFIITITLDFRTVFFILNHIRHEFRRRAVNQGTVQAVLPAFPE